LSGGDYLVNKVRKLQKEFNEADEQYAKVLKQTNENIEEISQNVEKKINDISNVNIIISDIDKSFAEKTGIVNIKDMTFLWGAIALQCARWILIPSFNEKTFTPDVQNRKSATEEGKKDLTLTGEELDRNKEERDKRKYPNWESIILLPVPYDAMKGTEDIVIPGVTDFGKRLYGGNHHSATLGHDPILGHIFGTANIMTRSITFHDKLMTTRKVEIESGRQQNVLKEPYGLLNMFDDVIRSYKEDSMRLTASHLKQVLHLQSDKYTKDGLPIPLIPAGMQQKLLKQKWNSKELENILKGSIGGITAQAVVAAFLNTSVGTLHGFCYNERKDEDFKLYNVRTRKIIATSNTISTAINMAAVTAGTVSGVLTDNPEIIKKSISHLDLGGYIVTIHQIARSKSLQEQIRREYLEKELYSRLCDNTYSFLEEAYHE